jgi:hypothetical protein
MHMCDVVTWQSPGGDTIDICPECEDRLTAAHEWPRDERGEDYCSVSYGLHLGRCEAHEGAAALAGSP